jgi:hypothetical protein
VHPEVLQGREEKDYAINDRQGAERATCSPKHRGAR